MPCIISVHTGLLKVTFGNEWKKISDVHYQIISSDIWCAVML